MHILRNVPQTLKHVFYVDGAAMAPTGTVTYAVTKADGTDLTSGNASVSGSTCTFTLAAQTNLNILKVAWTATVDGSSRTEYDFHEIVGAHLWSWDQLKSFDGGVLDGLSVDAIEQERVRIHDDLQAWTGVSWIPRFYRYSAEGDGSAELLLPHRQVSSLLTLTISGITQTVGNFTVFRDSGRLYAESGWFTRPSSAHPQNVVAEYEYGYEYPRDGVDRIGLMLLRERLVGSDVPDSATGMSDEMGTYRYERGATRNILINDWLRNHDHRLPVW